MTFDQLRVFVAVANRLHVTQAARDLNLTQSAVSASIAALEGRYGVRLFHRAGRRILLTEAGELLARQAHAVLASAAEAEKLLEDLSGLKRGTLAIFASQTIANYWLPPMLSRFHALYPDIRLVVRIGNTAQVVKAVLDGATDIGFVEGDVEEPMLAKTAVDVDQMILVVGATHPWKDRSEVGPAAFADTTWVMREHGSGTRQIFENLLSDRGFDPRKLDISLELPSNESVRSAVVAGAGATVISRLVVEIALRSGELRQIAFPIAERAFFLLRHRDRYVSKAEEAFAAYLHEQTPGGQRAV